MLHVHFLLSTSSLSLSLSLYSEYIWLADVHCTGNELLLSSCPGAVFATDNTTCTHSYDVGVVCSDSKSVHIIVSIVVDISMLY